MADPPRPSPNDRTAYLTCPLCEAMCGLELSLNGDRVTRTRGDRDDVFSSGFLCPKGTTLGHQHDDPDRLRAPIHHLGARSAEAGAAQAITWDQAWVLSERLLREALDAHGRDSVGIYLGNPTVHHLDGPLFVKALIRGLGEPKVFSASTVDQRPKEVAAGLMFGTTLSVPIPDIDRTALVVLLGANPLESNGSLATAPDWPGRLSAVRQRGGQVVVVDPRRTKTAEAADEHLPIRPGADALLLAAVVTELARTGRIDPGAAAEWTTGLDEAVAALGAFTPESVAGHCGLSADQISGLADRLAAAESAAVYGRIGTTTQRFGTVASWLVDLVNLCTGNLDRPGGAMFTKAAAGAANTRGARGEGRGLRIGRFATRVRGLGETLGELPVAALAEEIETEGPGRIKVLITVAGNPLLSTPNSARLEAAMSRLELMISIDPYLNETTRHADMVLPPPSPLQRPHYDLAFTQLAVRNVANYSPAVLPMDEGAPAEWEILARLTGFAQGLGPEANPADVDDLVAGTLVGAAIADEHGPVHGRDQADLMGQLEPRRGPERLLDLMLRTGPYGDAFGGAGGRIDVGFDEAGEPISIAPLSLDELERHPHGIDLGPLQPRLPEVLRTPSGRIEAAPPEILADVPRLAALLEAPAPDGLVLVGRRDLRSNNSWMHNTKVLVKGRNRCTLQIHPDDAAPLRLGDGDRCVVSSRVGSLEVPVELTEATSPGVVSLPHGWGHNQPGTRLSVANEHAGVNSNVLTDEHDLEPITGTAVLSGIPVEVAPA
ncbi:MAG: molybdopterin-dependent oxidoreductase [Microthrixaceae bacterium]